MVLKVSMLLIKDLQRVVQGEEKLVFVCLFFFSFETEFHFVSMAVLKLPM